MSHHKKAIVLSSGGIDSTTAMAMAKAEGYEIYSLSFFYGQRHSLEMEAAKRVARFLGARKHLVVNIDLRAFGGSALTDDIEVPKGRDEKDMQRSIPVTYVPARNTIFLSYALACQSRNQGRRGGEDQGKNKDAPYRNVQGRYHQARK